MAFPQSKKRRKRPGVKMKAEVYNTYGAYGRKASSYPKSEDDCHCCCSLSSAAESKINTINKRPQAFRVPRGRVLTRDLIKNKQQHSKLRAGETFRKDFGGNEWRRTLLIRDLPLKLRTYSLINNLTPRKNVACWEEANLYKDNFWCWETRLLTP